MHLWPCQGRCKLLFQVLGRRFRVENLGFKAEGSACSFRGLGCRVQHLGFGV